VCRWSPSGHGARAAPTHPRLPSTLADHLLPIEDLHGAGELHAPWPGNTLNLVVWGLGDAQLAQQTVKLSGNSQ
jgi:hypothetical protein